MLVDPRGSAMSMLEAVVAVELRRVNARRSGLPRKACLSTARRASSVSDCAGAGRPNTSSMFASVAS